MSEDASENVNSKRFAVVGFPVSHSASPALHNAAYAHLGIDAEFLAYETSNFPSAAQLGRSGIFNGFAVTMPHKEAAFEAAGESDEISRVIKASNTLIFGDQIKCFNTDAPGIQDAFEQSGATMRGAVVAILGSGGAARAAVAAAMEEAEEIVILARTPSRAEEIVALMKGRETKIRVESLREGAAKLLRVADVLINATPVGMRDGDPSPVDPALLHEKLTVMDMIYRPAKTRLIQEALSRCKLAIPGTRMFIAQAARQFALMTGRKAPVDVMEKALKEVPGCDWP